MEAWGLIKEIGQDNAILRRTLAQIRADTIEAWDKRDGKALNRLAFLEREINRVMGRDATQKL
jgi:hypothetical protein